MEYRVQPNDTLYAIAVRFGVPFEQLARVNNIAPPYQLYVGQRLWIPIQQPPRPQPPRPRPTPGNVERRLDNLEDRVDRLERQVRELDRRIDRLERPRPRQ